LYSSNNSPWNIIRNNTTQQQQKHNTPIHKLLQTALRSLVPLGDRVLVKRAPKETQTAAGIYLPSDKTKDPNEGSVIAVGPGERDVTGALHATLLKVGDTVLLPEYGGTKIKIDEDELFLFRESDILGKFE
jgi:chaperonin GroES